MIQSTREVAMGSDGSSSTRVGIVILAALCAFGAIIFLIGDQNNLFRSMTSYEVAFANVSGLQTGNPVQLNGVGVGRVENIELPPDPASEELVVTISIDSRYAKRVRKDSIAEIKTLGLLGDKFISITSGSEEAVAVPAGGRIDTAPETNVDALIASGEDAVDNLVSISVSMKNLLESLETGESFLGQLFTPLPEDLQQRSVVESLSRAVTSIDNVGRLLDEELADGNSTLARLLTDDRLARKLESSVTRLDAALARFEESDGLVAGLLYDPELKTLFESTLINLDTTSTQVRDLSASIEDSDGLLARLLTDEAYADRVTGELEELVTRLNTVAGKIAEADGTAGQLIEDPSLYDAMNDVVIGINESRLLRWLIRNRQKKGLETRYAAEVERLEAAGEPVEPLDEADR
ncbi:MAG: MlaD family protein [Acidobacteriota bacterium]